MIRDDPKVLPPVLHLGNPETCAATNRTALTLVFLHLNLVLLSAFDYQIAYGSEIPMPKCMASKSLFIKIFLHFYIENRTWRFET